LYANKILPKQGKYYFSIKHLANNHMSIGLISSKLIHNQYSFKDKLCICLYSYYAGNFRGIYNKSIYKNVEHAININDIATISIDMTQGHIIFLINYVLI
jgi:hypothetical protein